MLAVGSAMFLADPGQSRDRALRCGTVLESDFISFVATLDQPPLLEVGAAVSVYCDVDEQFFQQGAKVDNIRSTDPKVIVAFRRVGPLSQPKAAAGPASRLSGRE